MKNKLSPLAYLLAKSINEIKGAKTMPEIVEVQPVTAEISIFSHGLKPCVEAHLCEPDVGGAWVALQWPHAHVILQVEEPAEILEIADALVMAAARMRRGT